MDRLRDVVAGRASAADVRRLREDMAADGELLAVFDAYGELHVVTEAARSLVGRPPWRRRWLRAGLGAAAAIVLMAVVAVLLRPAPAPRAVVRLRSIPLSKAYHVIPDDAVMTSAVSDVLAHWEPVADGHIRWLSSLDEARGVATATGRPVLLFVSYPTCPLCGMLRKVSFTDGSVVDLVGRSFVPVNVDIQTASPEMLASLDGWPFLATQDAAGETLRSYPGYRDPAELRAEIEASLRDVDVAVALPWDRVHELALALDAARDAERERRLGAAFDRLEQVKSRDAAGAFGRAAKQAMSRIGDQARLALAQAEALDDAGRHAASSETIDRALASYAGTPFEADFVSVHAALEDAGRFPQLESAAR
jgi:hypothetical protein